ncbi:subtilisin-like serine protease [Cryptosporidium ryanae]|uniref:subtilisin-like serine protease n=1 Tax=Cryptosporidium ryanae TaxID=515981 RepID=UPI00351A868B|nr:subtilisin-like serine protease [Cryptosporidium ryanae]
MIGIRKVVRIVILSSITGKIWCNDIFNSSSITINVMEGKSSDVELVLNNPVEKSVTPYVEVVDRIYSPNIMKQQKPPEEYNSEYDDADGEERIGEKLGGYSRSENEDNYDSSRRNEVLGRLIIKYKEKVLSKAVREFSLGGIMSKNGQYPKKDGISFLNKVVSTLSDTTEELVGIKSATVLEALDMMIVEVFNNSRASEYISKLSASFLRSEEVEYVEPDQEVRLADYLGGMGWISGSGEFPNDPKFGEQWGMYNKVSNTDSKVLQAWRHLGINHPGYSNGGYSSRIENTPKREVIVAVIDTGVDYTHPDLVENMWINERELYGRPGVDDDLNGYVDDIYGYDFANNKGTPIDDEGHGTHCAGTIAAKGNNNEGISGINWNGVKIMALKFLRGNGVGFLSDSVKAINYAIKMGAHVLSNSWGGGSFSQATYDAIKRSMDKNMLFVVAAGNDRNNNDIRPTYPSAYQLPNVLSVAAIDIYGRLGVFSNYGHRSVDIAAPGVDILSTSSNKGYKRLSGTSMACPFVSGAAALLYAFDPNMTFDYAKSLLLKSVTILNSLRSSVKTSGTLNIYRAVQMMNQEVYNNIGNNNGNHLDSGKDANRKESWIVFKAPETIGPKSSSILKLKAIGEKSGSYSSSLVVKLVDSNDKNTVMANGRLKTIINVVSIPRPKAVLPNGNSTNLGLTFVGLEGLKTQIPIKNTGIGTLEYMVEFINIDDSEVSGGRKRGRFKVYPPLGTILSVKEEQINRELQVSCIPSSFEGFISGHLILKYNKGSTTQGSDGVTYSGFSGNSNLNRLQVKPVKFPYVRTSFFGDFPGSIPQSQYISTALSSLTHSSSALSPSSVPIGTERLAIRLYCKGYGVEVKPPSINRVIRSPERTISGIITFRGLENSIKPRIVLRFKSLQDDTTGEQLGTGNFESSNVLVKNGVSEYSGKKPLLPPDTLSPTKSYFKMTIPNSEGFPSKKRIIYRLDSYDQDENEDDEYNDYEYEPGSEFDYNKHKGRNKDGPENKRRKITVSLDDVLVLDNKSRFEWIDVYSNHFSSLFNDGYHSKKGPTVLTDLLNSDDGVQKVKLPVPWYFLGERVREIYVSVNGFISFSPIYSEAFVPALPSYAPPHGIIAPLWTDFTTKGARKGSQVLTMFKSSIEEFEKEDFYEENGIFNVDGNSALHSEEMELKTEKVTNFGLSENEDGLYGERNYDSDSEYGQKNKPSVKKDIYEEAWEFVIEWRNLYIKSEQLQSKTATFQCVLNSNGSVRFNYLKIPWGEDLDSFPSNNYRGNEGIDSNLNHNSNGIILNRISSSSMLGWESIDGIRGVGIPCTNRFPVSESTIELIPENPKVPWFQLSETTIPPLQRSQMTYKVNWRVTLPSNLEEQIYKGKINVSTSDGAVSVIPVTVTALNEERKEDINKKQSENSHEDEYQALDVRGLSEKKQNFDVFIS